MFERGYKEIYFKSAILPHLYRESDFYYLFGLLFIAENYLNNLQFISVGYKITFV